MTARPHGSARLRDDPARPAPPAATGRERILIIDDNRDFADSLATLLEIEGIETEVLYGAFRAETARLARRVDIALVDLRLARDSGLSLIKEIHDTLPEVLCVVMTAYASIDTAILALKAGAYDYLRKPFAPGELLAIVTRCREHLKLRSERAEAERARAHDEARFRDFAALGADWIWEIDASGRLIESLGQVERITGQPAADLIGAQLFDIVVAPEPGPARPSFRELLSRHEPLREQQLLVDRPDGERRILELNAGPILDGSGEFSGYRGVVRDITERVAAAHALRRQEARFRGLVENTRDGVWETDGAGRFSYVSPRVGELLGRDVNALVGQLRADHITALAPEVSGEAAREMPFRLFQARHIDGHEVLLESSAVEILDDYGRPNGLRGVDRDVTERLRLERESKEQQHQLMQASRLRALGTLVSGVAHEINNPNNLLMMNAELLAACWRDVRGIIAAHAATDRGFLLAGLPFEEMAATVPDLINDITAAGERIKKIVDDLKGFAQPSARLDPEFDVTDVNDVVERAINLVRPLRLKATDRFSVELDRELAKVLGDASRLEQAVVNLLVNALESLADRSRAVTVRTRADVAGDQVRIEVIDEGSGMTAEQVEKVFDPFFTTKQAEGGTGLGLAIAYRIVADHGGSLDIVSEPRGGTQATIVLPSAD